MCVCVCVKPGLSPQTPSVGPRALFPIGTPIPQMGLQWPGEWEGMRAKWSLFPLPHSFPQERNKEILRKNVMEVQKKVR